MNCPVIHEIHETNKTILSDVMCTAIWTYMYQSVWLFFNKMFMYAHHFVVLVFFLCSPAYLCLCECVCACDCVCVRERKREREFLQQKKVTAFESCAKHIWTYLVYCNNTNNNNNNDVCRNSVSLPTHLRHENHQHGVGRGYWTFFSLIKASWMTLLCTPLHSTTLVMTFPEPSTLQQKQSNRSKKLRIFKNEQRKSRTCFMIIR